MIILGSSSVLKISLGGTVSTNQLVFTAHYVDLGTTSFTPGSNDGLTNNTTQVTIISSPTSGITRQTKYVSIFNNDTTAQKVTITFNNGADRIVVSVNLQADYSLTYNIESGWQVTDTNGSIQYVGNTGAAGTNAYTVTSANFTQPAVNSTVNVTVGSTAWMSNGQTLFIQDGSNNGGYYSVSAISSSTMVVLKNLGYTGNSAPSTTILSSAAVVAGGIQGAIGSAGPPDYLYITNN